MLSTTTKGFKRNTSNKILITQEQFNEVFPRGYRECNFFSSPVEFWSMGKEACWDWKQTALLDLNSKINLQKNLQQTSIIGHSSDTKLLTELLNRNIKDLNIESTYKNTSINNNVSTITETLRRKISKNKKCYTCNNICKCSRLLSNRFKNSFENSDTIRLLSKAQFVFLNVQFIDQMNKSSIKISLQKNKINLPKYISMAKSAQPNTSENCDILQNVTDSELEKIFYDNNVTLPMETLNNIESRPTTPSDNRVVVTEMTSSQIMNDETTDENNEHKENVLKYFNLNSISDIFQDVHDDDDGCVMYTGFNEMVYS